MRNRDTLWEIEDIALLQQYLYMNEEHSITVKNAIDVPLEIRMDERGRILQKNLNFRDLPPMENVTYSIPVWQGIIDQLKEQPLKDMADQNVDRSIFKNRWEEIKILTRTQLSLNRKQD